MKTANEKLAQWAINKITREYREDVCLLVGHDTLKLPQDTDGMAFSYYIPATEKAETLGRTFIVEGIGYDLFPMSWERIEGLASLDGYNTSCLGDVKILYARSEEDKQRYISLQNRLRDNLNNPAFMFGKALPKLQYAMEIYQTMLFAQSDGEVRNCAGHICDFLSIAVAFINGTYFKNGQTNELSDLAAMKKLPDGFISLYNAIVATNMGDELKKLCYDMICATRRFLDENKPENKYEAQKKDFHDLAGWYQELCYTWRRIYHWCNTGNTAKAFIWGCGLHHELDIVSEEFGLGEMDLMGAWDAGDLRKFLKRAEELEYHIVSTITSNGVKIDEYATIEEFLAKNS